MMKRKITCVLLLAFAMLSYHTLPAQTKGVTVTGNCFLEGQTNHSGIKVLFTAVSPSAVTTEVFTTSNGAFVAGLAEGIYMVEYSKEGYVSSPVHENYSFFTNTILDDVTLLAGGTLEVSGPQSGVWESGYLVKALANISVPAGDTLIIQPGVTVKFMGNFAFEIHGTLLATGMKGDSIVFTSGLLYPAPNDWRHVKFIGSGSSGSILINSVVQFGNNGIYCESYASPMIANSRISHNVSNGIYCLSNSTPIIQNNNCKNNTCGIYCSNASPILHNNFCNNNNYYGIYCSMSSPIIQNNNCDNNYYGIYCFEATPTIQKNTINSNTVGIMCISSQPAINNNDIIYNNSFGIRCEDGSSPSIMNNNISHNNPAISCASNSSPTIKYNTIDKNSDGICCYYSFPTIQNNTISYNYGMGIYTTEGSIASILNNIIVGNSPGILLQNNSIQNLSYNLFWKNTPLSEGFVPNAFNAIVTQNINGDSCDTYYNLFMDPMLVQIPEPGNYSWEVVGDTVNLLIGYQPQWRLPYYVYVMDQNFNFSELQEMDWNGEYYYKKLPLIFPQNHPIYVVSFIDNYGYGFNFEPDFSNNPTGPVFNPGTFDPADYHLTQASPCIDAGNPDTAYYDPDGTIADIGAFYFDQGSAAPVINDFTATPATGRMPLVVQFSQDISGPALEYQWVFGDGSTSTLPNPVHVYNAMGYYTVSLMVSGPGGSDILVKTDYIHVLAPVPPLNPAFTASPLLGYAPLEVQFTNQSTGPWQTLLWDFGDGSTSTELNPLHVYGQPGDYSVSLTLFVTSSEKTELKENYIHAIAPQEVVAQFSVSGNHGAAPYTVAFFDQSFGSVDSLRWNFGEGTVSTLANPTHVYLLPGEYTATLTAYGPLNTSTASETILVESVAPVILAIIDRPNDQGGYVYVQFKKSFYDNVIPGKSTESYTIQRQDNGHWVSLGTTLAYGEAVYTVEAATLNDSTTLSPGITAFRVIAGMDEGTWISQPGEGYSVDNLAPSTPDGMDWLVTGSQLEFSWNPCPDQDFRYFAVYKSDENGLFPGTPVATLTGTSFSVEVAPGEVFIYAVTAFDFAGNESLFSEEASNLHRQEILIPQGWSGISGYLEPYNSEIGNMFAPIAGNLTILMNETGMYWPGQNVNTLGTWQISRGYQIKMTQQTGYSLRGFELTDHSLSLAAGWSLMPVLSENNAGVADLFAATGLELVKEVAGFRLYWPAYGINTLGYLEPGRSYQVLMDVPGTIVFPAEPLKSIPANQLPPVNITPWNEIVPTPVSHAVAFSRGACSDFVTGDIVAAFTSGGLCAGMQLYQSGALGLAAFGDDAITDDRDGFLQGEVLDFRLFRPTTGEEFDLEVTWDHSLNTGDFTENGVSVVTSVKMSPLTPGTIIPEGISIFPNPSHGIFSLTGPETQASIAIFNAFGTAVTCFSVPLPGEIDLSGQPKGVYFLQIKTGEGVFIKKLVLN